MAIPLAPTRDGAQHASSAGSNTCVWYFRAIARHAHTPSRYATSAAPGTAEAWRERDLAVTQFRARVDILPATENR